jgi:hypothetical protein
LVGGDGHELVSGIANSRGGEAKVYGTLDESRAVDFPGEQLAFQQRKLHAVRSGRGIKHGRSPSGGVAAKLLGDDPPKPRHPPSHHRAV